jgi:hypothetical protein
MSSDEAIELSVSAELTEATATTVASCEEYGVKFNNKIFKDWGEALVALRLLIDKNKNDSTSGWYRADVILEPNGSFSLRCSSCERGYSITNPANFWSTHKKGLPRAQAWHGADLCGVAHIAQRSSLGMQRAKALIAICSAEKAKIPPSEGFQITLDVLDGDV